MSSGAGLGSLLIFALPLVLLVYLMMVQRRRGRAVSTFQAALAIGDEVVTTSGLLGTVVALDDAIVSLEVAPGTVVRLDRRAVGMDASSLPLLHGNPAVTDGTGTDGTGTSGTNTPATNTPGTDTPGTDTPRTGTTGAP
ncbi:MAG TPA: preprotein translocase subunit YajC [Dermatophilaceae bacterium]|nr:preprotein translocase subunit YajC [Dermatophilaceae bacterium]